MIRLLLASLLTCLLAACASPGRVQPFSLDGCRGHLARGDYAEAERRCSADFTHIEERLGAQNNARQLIALATSAVRYGDYRIAERAATLAAAYDGEAIALIAIAKNNLGDYSAAIARGSEYLALHGATAPMAIEVLTAMGTAHATLGRIDEARRMVKIANEIAATTTDSYATVGARTLEASVLWIAGDRQASGELAAQALALGIQSGFDTSALLGRIAKLKISEAKYDEARALLEKSLGVSQLRLWHDHPDYARVMHDLARVDDATGKTDDAETRYLLALKVRKNRLGATHTLVAQTLNNLGTHYHRRGDLDQAAALYERALDINIAVLGRSNRRTQLIFDNLEMLAKDRRSRTTPPREPIVDSY